VGCSFTPWTNALQAATEQLRVVMGAMPEAPVAEHGVARILATRDAVGHDPVVSEVALLIMASPGYTYSSTLLDLGVSHTRARSVCFKAWDVLGQLGDVFRVA